MADLPDGLVLIDGECVLCAASFRFVAQRDRSRRFLFAPMQGAFGREVAHRIGIDPDRPDSFALISGGRALLKSDGAIAILRALPGWGWISVLLIVPRAVRDWVYDRIARNRYRLFGRLDACLVPDAALKAHIGRSICFLPRSARRSRSGRDVPVVFTVAVENGGERWTRSFGDGSFRSQLCLVKRPCEIEERFGPLSFRLALVADRFAAVSGDTDRMVGFGSMCRLICRWGWAAWFDTRDGFHRALDVSISNRLAFCWWHRRLRRIDGVIPTSASRFFDIASRLCLAVGNAIRPGFIDAALAMLVVRRIQRVRNILLALEARFLAGQVRRRQSVSVSVMQEGVEAVVRRRAASPARLAGPLGWLCPLVPAEAACFAGHLRVVLAEPEMQALLAGCPQAVRVLGPLCRMLGIERAAYVPGYVEVVRVRARVAKAPLVRVAEVDPRVAHYASSGVPRRFWFKVPRRWK
eukprot:gene4341-4390_t